MMKRRKLIVNRNLISIFVRINQKKKQAMATNHKVTYWVEMSDYDLETASAMLTTGRYLYVGFMCHQAIEKILKARICSISEETPPYIHNLSRLAEKAFINEGLTDDQYEVIDLLDPLNIEARYPSYKEKLMKSLTQEKCITLIEQTKKLQQWIKTKL
ncbi:HEPN domain-containing protein [Macellibacteroides fermentans]